MKGNAGPALYVHIPFCLSRCRYCGFHSGLYESAFADAYIGALRREMALRDDCRIFSRVSPASVFIGGGTPSALSLRQCEALFSLLRSETAEFSIEANPDSVDAEKLRLFRQAGINRLSLGAQTFSPAGLKLLGRRHSAETIRRAALLARELGFENVNIDLIFAYPGQSAGELRFDLSQAMALGVRHLSAYTLSIEEGTPFFRLAGEGKLRCPDDEASRTFWDIVEETLERSGFRHYEISNYCLPGFECRHNSGYWTGTEYVGLGASAHSFVGGRRFANAADSRKYVALLSAGKSAEDFSERLGPVESARECAVFWLRLADGIDARAFRERTGYALESLYEGELPPLLASGALEWADGRLRISRRDYPLADMILADLV